MTSLELLVRTGISGTMFGLLFSALGKGNYAKYVSLLTALLCFVIVGKELFPVVKELFALMNP